MTKLTLIKKRGIFLIGKKFGLLTVLEKTCLREHRHIIYKCQCDCGNIAYVSSNKLKRANTKSCGCLKHAGNNTIHGKTKTRLYSIWSSMKQRCYNKTCKDYKYYGERGIKVCQEWLNDFQMFYNWATENNYRDDLTIDRVDNNKGYSPDNCHWADMQTQNSNQHKNIFLTYNGKCNTISWWSKLLDIPRSTISWRKSHGYSDAECLSQEEQKCGTMN